MTITEFLLARIAEDEATASQRIDREVSLMRRDGLPDTTRDNLPASWRRPLAECEAKRRIVELHPIYHEGPRLLDVGIPNGVALGGCETCHSVDRINADAPIEAIGPCDTLCVLASVYADHPGFDQAWKV